MDEIWVCLLKAMPKKGDLAGNMAKLERLFKQVPERGIDVLITPEGYLDGYVSKINMELYTSFEDGLIGIQGSNNKTIEHQKVEGFTYQDTTVIIQRRAENDSNFVNIGIADYVNESYSPLGTTKIITTATASYQDKNVMIGKLYYYRIRHLYEGKAYYTLPRQIMYPIRSDKTFSLEKTRRIDLAWDDSWIPTDGDVYESPSFEIKLED